MKQISAKILLILWIPFVLFIDYLTPLGVADGILYLPGVVYAMFFHSKKLVCIYAIACTAGVVGGIFLSSDAEVTWHIIMINRIYSVLAIWLVTFFVITRLSQSQTVEKLSDMITMSAWNKQVNYNGKWVSIEEYLKKALNISVSHGIDPESAAQLMRDVDSLTSKEKKV